MLTNAKHTGLLAGLVTAMVIAAPASADRRWRDKADGDVESVKASMWASQTAWHVDLRYEVEIEDAQPDRFEVIITFSERGRLLREASGKPVEIFDALTHPTDIDDDEMEFEQALSITLPRELVIRHDRLKVRVEIVDRQTGRVVDDKSKSVKVKRPRRRKCGL